jgi:hypothetical protein
VHRVEEKKMVVSGRKNADGTSDLVMQSGGWWVTFGNLAFHVGDVEPAFKTGDKCRITIERID